MNTKHQLPFAALVVALGVSGPSTTPIAADESGPSVWAHDAVSIVDPADPENLEVDITEVFVSLGGDPDYEQLPDGLYMTVFPFGGFPSDDPSWAGGTKTLTWHFDTDLDGTGDYEVRFLGGEGFNPPVEVYDASGALACTATWSAWFDDPFPYNGYYTTLEPSCLGNPAQLQWYVEVTHLVSLRFEDRDRAPDSGWSPVVTNTNRQPSMVATSGRVCFEVAGEPGDAAIVNLTPVGAYTNGFGLLVSSDVTKPPVASNVNFAAETVDPNIAIAPIGEDGTVCYVNSEHSSVHLVADHLGSIAADAYTPATTTGAPRRVLDTRSGPKLPANGRVCFAVAGEPGDAAIVNLTPVSADGAGNGVLVSSDVAEPPVASNVNFAVGTLDPNIAVAPIGADGEVCFENSRHTSVHLVADHLGSVDADAYTPANADGAPKRVADTRSGAKLAPNARECFEVAGDPGDASVVNLTPVAADGAGNGLLVASDVLSAPVASNVNFAVGTLDPNVALSPIGADGSVCYVNSRHTSTHLVADHLGSIESAAYTPASPDGAPKRVLDTREG